MRKEYVVSVVVVALIVISMLYIPLTISAEKGFEDVEDDEIIWISKEEGVACNVESKGGEVLQDYPDHLLVRMPKKRKNVLEDGGIDVVSNLQKRETIYVRGDIIDVADPSVEYKDELTIDGYENGEKGGYLVHMIGPIHQNWRRTLEEMGVEIMNYVPNYAYEVYMSPEVAKEVEGLDFVDWVGVYQPGYKFSEDIEPGLVSVDYYDGTRVSKEVGNRRELINLARSNEVSNIEEFVEPELYDEMSTQIIGGGLWIWDPTNDPDSAYREKGDYGSLANQMGYEGEGIVTAIADTGLGDGTTPDAGHADFEGRVLGGFDYESGTFSEGEWDDSVGHGTHVTGSVGAHTHDGSGEKVYEDYYAAQGSAPGSEFYVVKIFGDDGGFVGPSDYFEIVEIPKQEEGAYVHSNSWGARTAGSYITSDSDFDRAVRDANRDTGENEPMIITASAGNSGPEDNTVGSPGNAKNVITVGATENYNPPQNVDDPESLAHFSSRGWTDDNRVKPDVVAPGQEVYSTVPGGYQHASGTSMSNPAVAGAASVVVEWYEEEYGIKPSPSMVRGLLINTAYSLENNQQTNLENTPHIPNQDEGWGMVNLPKVIDADVNMELINEDNILQTGEIDEKEIKVDDPSEPLKITLTWTDKEAQPGDDWTLKNDLNLEVKSPSGRRYRGNNLYESWSVTGPSTYDSFDTNGDGWDDVNNVQNVFIPPEDLEDGVYSIWVSGNNVPADANNDGLANQDYSLISYNSAPNHPWSSFGQDEKNRGRSPFDTSHISGMNEWFFETDEGVNSSPAVRSDGTVYIGAVDNSLYAVAPGGEKEWSYEVNGPINSSPAIAKDGTVYFGSDDNHVYALHSDGTEKWNFETGGAVKSSPAVGENGTVYVGSQDGSIYALAPNGTEMWSKNIGSSIDSSAAINDNGTVFIGSDDENLYALAPNGTEKWSFKTAGPIETHPTIDRNGTIYVGSTDGNLYAISSDGNEKWSFGTGGAVHTPSIGEDGTVYFASLDTNLYALNPNGTMKWEYDSYNSEVSGSPAIGADGTIYLGDDDSNLHALNPDGTLKWDKDCGGGLSSPAIGRDGGLYAGIDGDADNNGLYGFKGELNAEFSWLPREPGIDREVQFRDESKGPEHEIMEWSWDFEDGNSSDEKNPVHIYDSEGIYNVTLQVTDDNGNTDSQTRPITVHYFEPPTANFTWKPERPLIGEEINFTDQSDVGDNNISIREWSFDDGTKSTGENPTHSYGMGGEFNVTLYLEDERSYTDSQTHTVNVREDFVYTIGEGSNLTKIDGEGEVVWSIGPDVLGGSARLNDLCIDAKNMDLYIGDSDGVVRKIDDKGNNVEMMWDYDKHDDPITGLAYDKEGYVYTSGEGGEVHKVAQDGYQEWVYEGHSSNVNDVAVSDKSGDIHTVSSSGEYHKLTPEGTLNLKSDFEVELTRVETEPGGSFAVLGSVPDDNGRSLFQINESGKVMWESDDHNVEIEGISIDIDHNVYTVGKDEAIRKFSKSGDVVWEYQKEGLGESVAAGPDKNIYSLNIDENEACKYLPEKETFDWEYELGYRPTEIIPSSGAYSSFPENWVRGLKETPWPISGGDEKRTSLSPYDTNHVDGNKMWEFSTDGVISRSTPVIDDDGTIYIGSDDGYLYAIHQNGSEKWKVEMGHYFRGSVAIAEDDSVIAISQTAPRRVYALDPEDGSERWSVPAGGSNSYGPTIHDGVIYYSSYSRILHAVDIERQEKLWEFGSSSMPSRSSPTVGDDGTIYIGDTDDHIYAINPDGTEKWSYETGGWVNTDPVIAEDGTVYVASTDYNLYAFNPNGTKEWVYDEAYRYMGGSSPALGKDGTIYVGCQNGCLVAIDPDTGEEIWLFTERRSITSSPAIGDDGMLYVGTNYDNSRGYVRAIHTKESWGEAGTERWSYRTGDRIRSSPAINSDGDVFIGSDDGNLYAFGNKKTLTIDSTEGGNVTEPGEGSFIFDHGEDVGVEALPDTPGSFYGWTGDLTGDDNKTTITMDENKELTAWFKEIDEYNLTIYVKGNGTTRPGEGIHTYNHSEEVEIKAIPDDGWSFKNWTGDHETDRFETSITMDENKTVTANFNEVIEIRTAEELQGIENDLSEDYVIVNDICASRTEDWNEGKGFSPIGDENNPFTGSLDGQGHRIFNLTIDRPDTDGVGLFGYVKEDSEIKDVGLENADISGDDNVGGLAGYNYGTISRTYTGGSISGDTRVGGLIGRVYGDIFNSYSTADVTGRWLLGGLIADIRTSSMSLHNSYSTGEITGDDGGGLVASCYNIDSKNLYWNNQTSGQEESDAGERRTTEMLTDYKEGYPHTYQNWDFEDTWNETYWNSDQEGNKGYPALYWEDKNRSVYELEINVEGDGSVAPDHEIAHYKEGCIAELEAIPAEHWAFEGWSGSYNLSESEISVLMDEDKTLTANFREKNYTLDVDVKGDGVVDVDPEREEYKPKENVTLSAVESEHWYFVEWKGDYTSFDDEINVTMDQNKSITAVFAEKRYTLEVSTEGEGYIDVEPEKDEYNPGDEVNLTAIAEQHWFFVEWRGDHVAKEENTTIVMDENKSITGVFEEHRYTLNVTVTGMGRVEIDPDQTEYEPEEKVNLTAISDEHWYFVEWREDFVGDEKNVTVVMDKNKSITAVFEEHRYTLNVTVYGMGEVTIEPNQTEYEPEKKVNLSAISDEHWYFVEWKGDIERTEKKTNITMDGDRDVSVHFEERSYFLEVEIEGEGCVDIEPEKKEYMPEDEVNLTAIAEPHWYFTEWDNDLAGEEKNATIIMDENKSVVAIFEEHRYRLNVTVVGMGEVEIEPEKSKYEPEEKVNLTAISDEHWYFVKWREDVEKTQKEINITMDSQKNVTAHFEEYAYSLEVVIEGGGDVDIEPMREEYQPEEIVDLTAIAEEHWYFQEWKNDISTTEKETIITMDDDKEITAVFIQKTYNLDISVEGNGHVNVTPSKDYYEPYTEVELTPVASDEWYFDGWSDEKYDGEEGVVVGMDKNRSLTAVFEEKTPNFEVYDFVVKMNGFEATITAEIENIGTGEGMIELIIDGKREWKATLDPGEERTLYKTHMFEERGNYTVVLGDESQTVEAKPGEPDYLEISPSYSEITRWGSESYTATAYDEHDNKIGEVTEKTDWSIEDGAGGSWSDNEYASANVGEWKITGEFDGANGSSMLVVAPEPTVYELEINIIGNGTTFPKEGVHTYEEGEEVFVITTPDDGWYFDRYEGDAEVDGNEIRVIVDEDKKIDVFFEETTSEFEVHNLTTETDGLEVTITAEIENKGKERGNVELIIDDEVVKTIYLEAGEKEKIRANHRFEEEGLYEINIVDKSETVNVVEDVGIWLYLLIGGLSIVAVGAGVVLTKSDFSF